LYELIVEPKSRAESLEIPVNFRIYLHKDSIISEGPRTHQHSCMQRPWQIPTDIGKAVNKIDTPDNAPTQ
jgi:hypothetical protein